MIRLPLLVCLLAPVLIIHPTGCLTAQGLASQPGVARNPQDPKTITVIGRGHGIDEERAVEHALRDAVSKVTFPLIRDPEAAHENDEIIEAILTHSGGYIEEYKVLETEEEDSGLFRVKVEAGVKKTQLEEKLAEGKVITKKVDGKLIYAKARSKLDEKKSSALIFRKAFEGFPLGVIKASYDGEWELVSEDESSAKVGVKVRMELDVEAWENWVARLDRLVGPIARDKGTWRPSPDRRALKSFKSNQEEAVHLSGSRPWTIELPRHPSAEHAATEAGLPWEPDTFLFLVAKRPGSGQEVVWYQLPRDPLLFEVARVWPTQNILTVSVVDDEGIPLAGSTFSANVPDSFPNTGPYPTDMQSTPMGAFFQGGLKSYADADAGEYYKGWIEYDRPSGSVGQSGPMGIAYNFTDTIGTSDTWAIMMTGGFFQGHQNLLTDGYTLPFVLDVPLADLESVDQVEVRLSGKLSEKIKTIDGVSVFGDRSTSISVPFKPPADGGK